MNPALRGRFVVPALLSSLMLVLAACGGSDADKDADTNAGAATTACGNDITQTASTQLPSDVPAPSGADSAYQYFAQGATKVWYFAIAGDPGDLVSLRDSYDQSLESKGYKIEGTDQEENAEAESEFSGAHDGTTNFRPLCEGKDVLRLKLTS
jgi:hypothetical protein